jgi:hypothetical protein
MVLDSSGYLYDPKDRSCDGYPKLAVQTLPGTCLGMVLPRARAVDPSNDRSFVKPRRILQIPGTGNFLVVDMGGWSSNNGRLFLTYPDSSGQYQLKLLKFPLDNPHALTLGPDGYYYIGEKTQISRFHLQDINVIDWQIVIGKLAKPEGYMHPLSQFVFDPRNGDLYINSGTPSDHCFVQETGTYKSCPESDSLGDGSILRIPAAKLKNLPADGVQFYEYAATGLRNSMAMAISSAGFLVQGENSRDFPELAEPYEEINVVDLDGQRGNNYGWPYCYNFHAVPPEWISKKAPIDCSDTVTKSLGEYQAPHALMPPHVSPLHMDYYNGAMFSDLLKGKLLVTWHGYQPTGHRLVAYDVDAQGRPMTEAPGANAKYSFDQASGCAVKKNFSPRGGMDRHAPYTEVISQWNLVKGLRPKGAPVSFTEADDGSLWIIEDLENRDIVRLAKSSSANYQEPCEQDAAAAAESMISMLAWRHQIHTNPQLDAGYRAVQTELIEKNCLGCHGNMRADDIRDDRFSNLDFMFKNNWIESGNPSKSKIYGAITHLETAPPMPPMDKRQFFGTPEGEHLNNIVKQWIGALPQNIEATYTHWNIKDARNIRLAPSKDGKVCGQFLSGDLIFGDMRPTSILQTGNIKWYPVFVIPSHSRLSKEAPCAYPEDGVFYIAN